MLPPGYAYSHTSLPCAHSLTLDISAQAGEYDNKFDPDMLPNKGTSTDYYTICYVVQLLTLILKTRVAN
jgi:hypothetical protein